MPKYKTCHYCDIQTSQFEMDHFPIPNEMHGTRLVTACYTCHMAKDRSRMDDIVPSIMKGANKFDMQELVQKAFICTVNESAAWADACWEEWTREQRILVARILRRRFEFGDVDEMAQTVVQMCNRVDPDVLQPMHAEYVDDLNRKIAMLGPDIVKSWYVPCGPIRKAIVGEPSPVTGLPQKKRGCGLVAHTRPNKKK